MRVGADFLRRIRRPSPETGVGESDRRVVLKLLSEETRVSIIESREWKVELYPFAAKASPENHAAADLTQRKKSHTSPNLNGVSILPKPILPTIHQLQR